MDGMDGNERIQWALDFAYADLTMARSEDWKRLRADATRFLRGEGPFTPGHGEAGGIWYPDAPKAEAIKPDELKELQRQVKELLSVFQARQDLRKNLHDQRRRAVPAGGKWRLQPFASDRDDFMLELRTKDWIEAFLLMLMNLIKSKDTGGIRPCPIDGVLFARVRRQEYCSRRCANLASKRAHRTRLKLKKEEMA